MPDENLLATLEQSLRATRATRNRLASRLADVELEAEKLRTELSEMDAIAGQTEAAMLRILSSVISPMPTPPTDAEIEHALRRDEVKLTPASHSRHRATRFEGVTEAADGVDEDGVGRIALYFLPQAQHINVDRAIGDGAILSPHCVEQLVPAEDDTLAAHHEFQQPKLGGREPKQVSV